MTPIEAAQAQQRCDAATPGPWRAASHFHGAYVTRGLRQEIAVLIRRDNPRADEDAELIAHARTDLPAALAALAEARAANAKLTEDLSHAQRFLAAEVADAATRQQRTTALHQALGLTYPGHCDANGVGGGALEAVVALKARATTMEGALAAACGLAKDALALATDALAAVKAALDNAPGFRGPDDHAENSVMTAAYADYDRMVDVLKILKGAAG